MADLEVTSQHGVAQFGCAQIGEADDWTEIVPGTGDVQVTLVAFEILGKLRQPKEYVAGAIPRDVGEAVY